MSDLLWSRRFVRDGEAPRAVTVQERVVHVDGPHGGERIETTGAGWSFVRASQAIVGFIKDGWARDDGPGAHRFHPSLTVSWDPATTSHPAVEQQLGEALLAREPDVATLALAAPLVLLEWPVGFRFGEVFEAHRGASSDAALADVARALESQKTAKLPKELARVCAVTENAQAIAPLLSLLARGASFDGWMDVIDLCAAVGDPVHAPTLKRLAKGRVAADVRDALLAVARQISR